MAIIKLGCVFNGHFLALEYTKHDERQSLYA